MIVTTLIFAFEHCDRASDIVVQLHPFVVSIATFDQSHFTPRIQHDIVVYQTISSSWQIVSKSAGCRTTSSPIIGFIILSWPGPLSCTRSTRDIHLQVRTGNSFGPRALALTSTLYKVGWPLALVASYL